MIVPCAVVDTPIVSTKSGTTVEIQESDFKLYNSSPVDPESGDGISEMGWAGISKSNTEDQYASPERLKSGYYVLIPANEISQST